MSSILLRCGHPRLSFSAGSCYYGDSFPEGGSYLKRWIVMRGILMVMVSALLLFACNRYVGSYGTDAFRIRNTDQIIASIRHGLREHSSCITIRFATPNDIMDGLTAEVSEWIEAALAETNDPAEGDYIRYQFGGYEMECSMDPAGDQRSYRVDIRPKYYLYLIQEEAVTEELEQVYRQLGFDLDSADLYKLQAIYAYVCDNVRYDQVHKKNPYFHTKSTAYSALIRHTATCQGYSVLLYRMLRDNGINCRIVTGTALGEKAEEFHAWNIAQLEGQYYYLDATWDAGKPADSWSCFLKGSEGFADHIPDPQFLSSAFAAEYPVSKEDAVEKRRTS